MMLTKANEIDTKYEPAPGRREAEPGNASFNCPAPLLEGILYSTTMVQYNPGQ